MWAATSLMAFVVSMDVHSRRVDPLSCSIDATAVM